MIEVSLVDTLYQKISRKAVALHYFHCLLVYVMGCEVLCDAAVICVTKFGLIILHIEEVINIDKIDVPTDGL